MSYHIKSQQNDFTNGEITPRLYGRTDLRQYSSSVKHLENFIVMPHGGIIRRKGSKYIASTTVKASQGVRLIPFIFNRLESYVVEFGEKYIRFYHKRGVLLNSRKTAPYEIVSPYSKEELAELNTAQSGDILYICHGNHHPQELRRLGASSWELKPMNVIDGPYGDIEETETEFTIETKTSLSTRVRYIQARGRGSRSRTETITTITFLGAKLTNGDITLTASKTDDINGGSGFTQSDVGRHFRMFVNGLWGAGRITTVISTSSVRVKAFNGFEFDFDYDQEFSERITGVPTDADYTPKQIQARKDLYKSTTWQLGCWTKSFGYPQNVTFYQNRLFFAGVKGKPNIIWGSTTNGYNVFSPTSVEDDVLDTSALSLTLASDRVNAFQWMEGFKHLLIGTSAGVFVLWSGSEGLPLTPFNVNIVRHSNDGSNRLKPIKVGRALIYVDLTSRKTREMAYSWDYGGYSTEDLMIFAEHLTHAYIKEVTYTQSPENFVWVLLENGKLLSMTYAKEHNVVAWSRHNLGGEGKIMSITAIPSENGRYDDLYLLVEREINSTKVYYVEVVPLHLEDSDEQFNATEYLDCSLSYKGNAVRKFTNLSHLEGEEVSLLVNRVKYQDKRVSAGEVILDIDATEAIAGYFYKSKVVTLDPVILTRHGSLETNLRHPFKVSIKLHKSYNISVGTREGAIYPVPFREFETQMGKVTLFSGNKEVGLLSTPEEEFALYIETEEPFPCNILSLVFDIEVAKK